MGTSVLELPISAAALPSGAASNAAPALVMRSGSNSNPVRRFVTANYDPSTANHLWWVFQMPPDYLSGGVVKLKWMANATSNAVVWGASLGAVTPADADTPIEHAQAAVTTATTTVNTTEARRLVETTITLANLDSVAAGDLISLLVYRDAANGSDTCTVAAELVSVQFSYTT